MSQLKRRATDVPISQRTAFPKRRKRMSQAARNAQEIKRIKQATEVKFFDTAIGSSTVTTVGSIQVPSLNLVTTGDTSSNRDGRKIQALSVHLKGTAFIPASTDPTQASDSLRVIIFEDKQCNGAAPSVTDILAANSLTAFRNTNNVKRFRILHDGRYDLVSKAGSWDGTTDNYAENQAMIEKYIKVQTPLLFTASTGAITDVASVNYGILTISNAGVAQFSGRARVRFIDM